MKSKHILRVEIRTVIASQVTATTESDGPRHGTWSFSSRDSPTPIQQASSCGISRHIGIPTSAPRIVGRPD